MINTVTCIVSTNLRNSYFSEAALQLFSVVTVDKNVQYAVFLICTYALINSKMGGGEKSPMFRLKVPYKIYKILDVKSNF